MKKLSCFAAQSRTGDRSAGLAVQKRLLLLRPMLQMWHELVLTQSQRQQREKERWMWMSNPLQKNPKIKQLFVVFLCARFGGIC